MGGGVLSCLKGKLGDLWWYTAWLFVAQRIGDVINRARKVYRDWLKDLLPE